MNTTPTHRSAALLLVAAALALAAPARAEQRKLNTKFAAKYGGVKFAHAAVKANKCEDCHLRHGLVPRLALKKSGNALCLGCHPKEKIGLDKPNVHPVLRNGSCAQCHDAHGSNAPHLLKAVGSEACYGRGSSAASATTRPAPR